MISRRLIRTKVMQAIFAVDLADQDPKAVYDLLLKDFRAEVLESEGKTRQSGDAEMLDVLYNETISNQEQYDSYIEKRAQNWELERIALMDRVLMRMGICEMLNLPEVPVKVSINEYLELAKLFSTPKSSRFINGILDGLYTDFKEEGKIIKKGRGLIDHSTPRQ